MVILLIAFLYLRLHITNGTQINNPTNTIRYGGL